MAEHDEDIAREIDARLDRLGGWRAGALARIRALIHEADPDVVEAIKWRKPSNPDGVLEWGHAGGICTGEVYRDKVKLTFHRGAALDDPSGVFNASLSAGTRRALDIFEGDEVDADAFRAIIRAAVAINTGG